LWRKEKKLKKKGGGGGGGGWVCHTLPFTLKKYLKAKEEELWKKLKIPISPCKNITFKKSSKRNQNSFKIIL